MSRDRPVPEHFKRDGQPKVSYPSREAAMRAAVLLYEVVYQCAFCGRWHRATRR